MRSLITKQAERFLRERKNYKRWLAVFFCLAVLVSLGTVMVLRYTGTAMTGDLTCGKEEHTHTDACYQEVLICGQEETEAHEHTEACYDQAGELICEWQEPEEAHVHQEACYEKQLVCEIEEHTHESLCYSKEENLADVETPEIWESTIPAVDRQNGDWAGNLVAVAKSQIGYQESSANVTTDEAGSDKGYSRYGAWYGNEYGAWNAMFASFCLNYAGIPAEAVTREADGQIWAGKLANAELLKSADGYLPQAGDLVFFQNSGDGNAAQVGIVSGVDGSMNGETPVLDALTVIAGDVEDQVKEYTYGGADAVLLGYLDLDEAAKRYAADYPQEAAALGLKTEETTEADFTEADLEEDDPQEPGVAQEAAVYELSQTAETESYIVTVSYNPDANLPEDAELRVEEYARDSEVFRQRSEELGYEPDWLLNIGFYQGEAEVEPESRVSVKVVMKDREEVTDYDIVHFAEEGMEAIDGVGTADESGAAAEFVTDGFTDYSGVRAMSDEEIDAEEVPVASLADLDGKSFMLVWVSDGGSYMMKNESPEDMDILLGTPIKGAVEVLWKFTKTENGFYIQDENGKYLNINDSSLSLVQDQVELVVENGGDGIRISKKGQYIQCFGGQMFNGSGNWNTAAQFKLYQMPELPISYEIKYWKNEYSIDLNTTEAVNKGTEILKTSIEPYEKDGRRYINIPLTGEKIGRLEDIWQNSQSYKFYGWSAEGSSANYQSKYSVHCGVSFEFPYGEKGITVPTYEESGVLVVDVTKRMNPVIDMYAIWAKPAPPSNQVTFHVRNDGVEPSEPYSYAIENYTKVQKANGDVFYGSLHYGMHIYGKGNKAAVLANLISKPSEEDLKSTLKTFDPETQYVSWYVCKYEQNGWHIDGVLMEKNKWNLVYNRNCTDNIEGIIPTLQYSYNVEATVYNTIDSSENQVNDPPIRTGYVFAGWNTEADGSGETFTAGDQVRVDQDGKVYKGGEIISGLEAGANEEDVRELVLYAQWAKGTNQLIVSKVDSDNDNTVLPNAEFTLYKKNEETWEQVGRDAITNSEGKFVIKDLENFTVYKLAEIKAPNGYETRKEFYFEVQLTEAGGEILELYETDEMGNRLEAGNKHSWLNLTFDQTGAIADIQITIKEEAKKQKATFKKVDENGDPLEGAKFTLYKKEGNDSWIEVNGLKDITSGKDGLIAQTNQLLYGDYKLEETEAPSNYGKTVVYFKVNDEENGNRGFTVTGVTVNGKSVGTDKFNEYATVKSEIYHDNNSDNLPTTHYDYTITVKNTKTAQRVQFIKVSNEESQTGLSGAKFKLYPKLADQDGPDLDKPISVEMTSGKDGIFFDGSLEQGIYYLVETQAPEGHIQLKDPVKITVTEQGIEAVINERKMDGTPVSIDGVTVYQIRIPNSSGLALPSTGGPGTIAYTFGGLALLAAGLVYGLSMKRKQERGYR